jgi:hypothetical protein
LLDVLAEGDPDLWTKANAIVQANMTERLATSPELG